MVTKPHFLLFESFRRVEVLSKKVPRASHPIFQSPPPFFKGRTFSRRVQNIPSGQKRRFLPTRSCLSLNDLIQRKEIHTILKHHNILKYADFQQQESADFHTCLHCQSYLAGISVEQRNNKNQLKSFITILTIVANGRSSSTLDIFTEVII